VDQSSAQMALERKLTRISGSHPGLWRSVDDADGAEPTMPIGGPRKLSQTSRRRDSCASLHIRMPNEIRHFSKASIKECYLLSQLNRRNRGLQKQCYRLSKIIENKPS
jgi:hypothetical protein